MLYLHCGWPKTGTTTFQMALLANRERLAAAGLVYPERWTGYAWDDDPSHNALLRMLKPFQLAPPDLDEFRCFLDGHRGEDLLLSSEGLFVLILEPQLHALLQELLAVAQETMPVTCLCTLRRLDEILYSLYLQRAMRGLEQPEPDEFLETFVTGHIFTGLRSVETVLGSDGEMVYVEYDPEGRHNAQLMHEFGLPRELADEIQRQVTAAARLNRTRTRKETAALMYVDALSERAGVTLRRDALRELFDRGDFAFPDDGRCVVGEIAVRCAVHERMLQAARESGVSPYARFFADEVAIPPPVALRPEMLDDEDLRRLAAAAGAVTGAPAVGVEGAA